MHDTNNKFIQTFYDKVNAKIDEAQERLDTQARKAFSGLLIAPEPGEPSVFERTRPRLNEDQMYLNYVNVTETELHRQTKVITIPTEPLLKDEVTTYNTKDGSIILIKVHEVVSPLYKALQWLTLYSTYRTSDLVLVDVDPNAKDLVWTKLSNILTTFKSPILLFDAVDLGKFDMLNLKNNIKRHLVKPLDTPKDLYVVPYLVVLTVNEDEVNQTQAEVVGENGN